MSAWRREALKRFPERSAEIRSASSIYDVLAQLEADVRAVYSGDRAEPELVDRIFEFASWGFAPARDESVRNAIAVGFYEHLPNVEAGRRDLAVRLSFETLAELEGLFFNMNTPESYSALQSAVEARHGRRLPRVERAAT